MPKYKYKWSVNDKMHIYGFKQMCCFFPCRFNSNQLTKFHLRKYIIFYQPVIRMNVIYNLYWTLIEISNFEHLMCLTEMHYTAMKFNLFCG